MKRKEERINSAIEFANAVTNDIQDVYFDIVMQTHLDATKWADHTMIDKACKWLKDDMLQQNAFQGRLERLKIIDGIIERFKKAMEEE